MASQNNSSQTNLHRPRMAIQSIINPSISGNKAHRNKNEHIQIP